MIHNKYVDEYINLWKQGKIILNKELIYLIIYKNIYIHEMMYILMNRKWSFIWIFIEKWYFPTLPFQRFIIANIFLINKLDEAFLQNLLFSWDVEAGKTV